MNTFTKLTVAAALAFSFAGFVHAEPGKKGDHEGKRPGARGERGQKDRGMMFKDLELTEEQKAKVKELFEGARAKREGNKDGDLREQMKAAREAGDKEKMMEIMKQAREKHMAAREAMKAKMEAILTPAQVEKLRAKRAEMKEKFGDREGRGKFGKGRAGKGGSDGKDGKGFRGGKRGPRGGKAGKGGDKAAD